MGSSKPLPCTVPWLNSVGQETKQKDMTEEGTEGASVMVPFLDSRKCLGRWKGRIPRLGQTLFKGSRQENTAGRCRMNVANFLKDLVRGSLLRGGGV